MLVILCYCRYTIRIERTYKIQNKIVRFRIYYFFIRTALLFVTLRNREMRYGGWKNKNKEKDAPKCRTSKVKEGGFVHLSSSRGECKQFPSVRNLPVVPVNRNALRSTKSRIFIVQHTIQMQMKKPCRPRDKVICPVLPGLRPALKLSCTLLLASDKRAYRRERKMAAWRFAGKSSRRNLFASERQRIFAYIALVRFFENIAERIISKELFEIFEYWVESTSGIDFLSHFIYSNSLFLC